MRTKRNPLLRRVSRLMGRTTQGFIVAAATLALLAPMAGATPETDAGDAINAAWTAAGGDASPLGAKDGDLYAAGPGFGQNFVGGAIFFSPDNGARVMYGAILDKYRALGGPADSDLGFPNTDEGPGRISPESRNSTFSAADHPVIFWTPDTGAWVVRGAINAAWDELGGSSGVLGVPTADETYDGDVVSQKFSAGQISFDARTKTFTTEPPDLAGQLGNVAVPSDANSAIEAAYRAAGGAAGPLGERQGDQFTISPNGVGQGFAGGKIFYTPATGAQVVSGAILEKYEAAGGPTGDLGLPNAPEADGGVPDSRVSSFGASDNPVIFWTAEHGAVVVRGAMKTAWDKLGGAPGALGVPLSDQSADGDKMSQKFSGGQLSWDAKSNKFTTDPANLAESLGGLDVTIQAPATPAVPNPPEDNAFAFHTWWLWWIIPLALLLLATLIAVLSGRRRRAGATSFDDDDTVAGVGDRAPRSTPAAAAEEPAYPSARWQEPEAPAVPQSRWGGPDVTETPAEHELFTHRGAHEAPGDQDAVDTAPTRVQAGVDDLAGRHAAVGRSDWRPAERDPYAPASDAPAPAPGSLFEPFYGSAPPPAELGADVMEPDVYHHDEQVDAELDAPEPDDTADWAAAERQDPAERGDDAVRWDASGTGEDLDIRSDESPFESGDHGEEPPEAHTAPPAIHLPLNDPDEIPEGYPVKGNMTTGTYHTPDSADYDDVVAEIWFADAQHAEANGFSRAD